MNITVICDVLGEANNGTTVAALNLINSLKEKGHNVKVVCPDKEREGQQNFFVVPVRNCGFIINKILENNNVKLSKPDEKILTKAIKDADAVHIICPFVLGRRAIKIAQKFNIPVTAGFHCQAENFTAHIGFMKNGLVNKIVYNRFYNKVFKHCDAIHYPTQFICDQFENSIKKKTKGVVISNGVSEEFFEHKKEFCRSGEGEGKFRLVCTGRFSTEKAQHILIEAAGMSKYKDRLQIAFAGQGPKKKKLQKLAEKLKVDCTFNFYSREKLIELLCTADLYVHTSYAEIEAIACLEAIACGLVPVICDSDKSATKAFALDEHNLFTLGSPSSLAQKIDFWIENEALKKEYAQKYKTMITGLRKSVCMDKMEEMIFGVCRAKLREKIAQAEKIIQEKMETEPPVFVQAQTIDFEEKGEVEIQGEEAFKKAL